MSATFALTGARLFDGALWHDDACLVMRDGLVEAIRRDVPVGFEVVTLDGGMLIPGFIDLQVNGGGGVMFNDQPTFAGIRTILAAHRQAGVTALMPTLITDRPEITSAAIAAGIAAAAENLPGFLGLHLEGPHLAVARKGAHNPALIRPMTEGDVAELSAAAKALPRLICTVAPEAVTLAQIKALNQAGVIVSLGHSDCDYVTASAAIGAGASMVTHLFNAMSQITPREPGVVGAALDHGAVFAGLIADGIHVHKANITTALRAKRGPGQIFLVSDAMAVAGTALTGFDLHGQRVQRADGALRLADGTLAGADLTMIDAVRFMHYEVGVLLDEALRMASLYPAQAVGLAKKLGHLKTGARASMVHLSDVMIVKASWIDGQPVPKGDKP